MEDMKKEKPAKATNAQIELRLKEVYGMVANGKSRSYIVRYASEHWGISDRQVDNYLQRVHEQIKEDFGERDRLKLVNRQLAKINRLYAKNIENETLYECRLLIELENKMLGLNEAEKVEVDAKQSITINEVKQYKDKL